MVNEKNLHQVVDDVLDDMKATCFSDNSIAVYRCAFNRMLSIADEGGDYTYTVRVKDKFLNDAVYLPDGSQTARIGNALVDYLIKERPESDSEYIFLCERTPHRPMVSSQGCRSVLRKVLEGAGIDCTNRSIGTRMTRHSAASRLVRKEIPLHIVSDALGHKNPESVLVYLSTDDQMMCKCTLDLPNAKGGALR